MRRLVIRPGAIGDFIVWLPAMACLETESFEVWTAARMVPLFPSMKVAGRARAISSTGLDLLGVTDAPAGLIEALREFDSIISDRKSTRLNSSHLGISYAVFCLKKKQQRVTSAYQAPACTACLQASALPSVS